MDAEGEPRLRAPVPGAMPTPDLGDREVAVLSELAREGEARVAFQGLRRRLHLHQQQLTRALRRLEEDGLVARESGGYRLTEQGFHVLGGRSLMRTPREILPIVQALLPPQVGAEEISAHLSGRYFRGMHWYGRADGPGETTLTWTSEPGDALVRVRIDGGALTLEAEVAQGDARRSFQAARAVLAALAEVYGIPVDDAQRAPVGALVSRAGVAA